MSGEGKEPPNGFFEWVGQCCNLFGWPLRDGVKLLPENDPCWFWCFDDGMTPEAAVREYKERVEGLH